MITVEAAIDRLATVPCTGCDSPTSRYMIGVDNPKMRERAILAARERGASADEVSAAMFADYGAHMHLCEECGEKLANATAIVIIGSERITIRKRRKAP